MPEMVERIAIELMKDEFRAFPGDVIEEIAKTNWFQFSEELKEKYLRPARAILAAMREPTKEMIKEGEESLDWTSSDISGSWYVRYHDGDSEVVWQAMIDEALK